MRRRSPPLRHRSAYTWIQAVTFRTNIFNSLICIRSVIHSAGNDERRTGYRSGNFIIFTGYTRIFSVFKFPFASHIRSPQFLLLRDPKIHPRRSYRHTKSAYEKNHPLRSARWVRGVKKIDNTLASSSRVTWDEAYFFRPPFRMLLNASVRSYGYVKGFLPTVVYRLVKI